MGKEEILKTGQNLFETLINVCYFTALEDDMRQIIFAVEKDNEKEINQLKAENEELKKRVEELKEFINTITYISKDNGRYNVFKEGVNLIEIKNIEKLLTNK